MINVFNIERFATHDGDGIRTVVFLQGCMLRCPWCSNPESQSMKPQLLYDEKKCIYCKRCEKGCPKKAISFENDTFVYDETLCKRCHTCVEECPTGALAFSCKSMDISDVVAEVMKDKDYYDASNGGVTISGGEAFSQFKPFLELVQACKDKGLNVAVETCGNFSNNLIKQVDPYIDTYLYDLKHLDKEIFRDICKGDLDLVLTNLESIDPSKVILRIPVIPCFNYDETILRKMLQYAKKINVKEVHFLAYHTLGTDKYVKSGMKYTWLNKGLNKKDLEKYLPIAQEIGVNLQLGG